jgi:hypothetical protein
MIAQLITKAKTQQEHQLFSIIIVELVDQHLLIHQQLQLQEILQQKLGVLLIIMQHLHL